ncbi:uncharacterized protein TNCV_3868081 [Trichonephila clavipes]|nr:uncharacterized protein TNCV_3868081 [Trichonephila clavipes]
MLWWRSKREEPTKKRLAVSHQILCSAESQSASSVLCKNTTYHEGIRQSPYEAIFGVKAKRGIASSFLPSKQIANIKTEEHLEEMPTPLETEEQLEETGDTFGKNFSGGHTKNHMPKKNIEEDLQSITSSSSG